MPFSDGGIVVEELDERFWQVAEPLEYHGATERFVVPAGFRTDFASVPRPVVWLIPRYGAYTKAAILHDYLLSSGVVSAADADGIFRRTLGELGVSVPRRWMMWAAVRFASRLRGATAGDIARFLLVAVLFLAVPVTVYLILFWFIELIAWAIHRSTHRPPEPAPTPDMKSA
ncbi:DUF1353 domain-containing protein [Nocardia cyriacigeorgica]|uniref:DUF1353 domain-containing protein n=1 Tax=Nocardia cyriacigeorgica TaxID=135487 RepID=UPI003EE1199F